MDAMLEKAEEKIIAGARRAGKGKVERAEYLWSRGFSTAKEDLYDFERHGVGSYLSDLQREMTRSINGPYAQILNNKIVFDQVFRPVVSLPEIVAYTGAGRLRGHLPDLCFYAKPVSGGGGGGVFRGEVNGGTVKVGEETFSRDQFEQFLAEKEKSYLVTRAVEPHRDISAFFQGTVNTLRVLSMRDADGPFIAAAALRVGCIGSGYVDNFSRGGISYAVDLVSGEIGAGRRKNGDHATAHPDTGAPITGRRVPLWDVVLEKVSAAMDYCQGLLYVGWDVVVATDEPVFIEGNNYSDVNLLQVHAPLLRNDRVRAFYQSHGILDHAPGRPLYSAP